MIATTRDAMRRFGRLRLFSVLALLMLLGALWVVARPGYLVTAQRRMVAMAAGQNWAVTVLSQPAWRWQGTLIPGTVQFATERLSWVAEKTSFVPDLDGGHWMAEGPHTASWGALGPVRFTGTIRIDVRPAMAISSDDVRTGATGAPVRLRWEPASFDGGEVTLSGPIGALGANPPWAPGLGQAIGAVLTLLAQPDGSVSVPLRRGADAVLAAGLPVLPWPRGPGR